MSFVKVTMNLTQSDVDVADTIVKHIDARSKASAVSFALRTMGKIIKILEKDDDARLCIERSDGSRDYIVL